jgi:hypothetical protein
MNKHQEKMANANLILSGYMKLADARTKAANAEHVLRGYMKLAGMKQAATAEELLNNTGAFNRLVDIEHKRQYQDWLRRAISRGMTIGGGAGALGGAALGLATRKPALAMGGGAIGGIGGGAGGRVLGQKMLENWDAKHGRGYVSKGLTAELQDRLINELKNESVGSAVGRASNGATGGVQGLLGSLGISGLLRKPRDVSAKVGDL